MIPLEMLFGHFFKNLEPAHFGTPHAIQAGGGGRCRTFVCTFWRCGFTVLGVRLVGTDLGGFVAPSGVSWGAKLEEKVDKFRS